MVNLQKKVTDLEREFHRRERELLASLEEARATERKLVDHGHHLEAQLEAAQAEAAALSLRLSAAEGRAQGLGAELSRVETLKREVELQLGSLHSSLRRTMGIGLRGRGPRPTTRGHSSSPPKGMLLGVGRLGPSAWHCGIVRQHHLSSPFLLLGIAAGGQGSPPPEAQSPSSRPPSPECPSCSEADPEAVRMALRDFLQELRATQQKRVCLWMVLSVLQLPWLPWPLLPTDRGLSSFGTPG